MSIHIKRIGKLLTDDTKMTPEKAIYLVGLKAVKDSWDIKIELTKEESRVMKKLFKELEGKL